MFTVAVFFLGLGSIEDRIVVGAFWLSLLLLPMESYIHGFAGLTTRVKSLRYVLLSNIGLIWVWANSRFRGGGGPFHIQIAGIWRGYPLPLEEWWWSQGGVGVITWSRDVHWLQLIADCSLLIIAWLFTYQWLQRSGAPVDRGRAMLLIVFTIAFTWLNIEPWIAGLPLTLAGPPAPFQPRYLPFAASLAAGFPLVYWNGFSAEPRKWLLVASLRKRDMDHAGVESKLQRGPRVGTLARNYQPDDPNGAKTKGADAGLVLPYTVVERIQ